MLFLFHLNDPAAQIGSGGGFSLMARHEEHHCFEETRTPIGGAVSEGCTREGIVQVQGQEIATFACHRLLLLSKLIYFRTGGQSLSRTFALAG